MRHLLIGIIISQLLFSCKEKDVVIEPVSIPDPASVISGRWKPIFTTAEGNAKISNGTFPVTGTNLNTPTGYYELKTGQNQNTYSYDIQALLNLVIGDKGSVTR